jgi:hypothetical protein
MVIETPRIIIDDELEMDVNTGIIGSGMKNVVESAVFPSEEIMCQIDRLENAISDLEIITTKTYISTYPSRLFPEFFAMKDIKSYSQKATTRLRLSCHILFKNGYLKKESRLSFIILAAPI